jgi:hypothetical protein
LASSLLQLRATPWLAPPWSKSTIYFLAPSFLSNHSQIDLSRPLISVKFDSGVNSADIAKVPKPRMAILELGIMMLKLWHETTLEAYCAGLGMTVDNSYLERAFCAQAWLKKSKDSDLVLPPYIEFVACCVKCTFGKTPLNPTWNSDDLIEGIIENVIEPLRGFCKRRK